MVIAEDPIEVHGDEDWWTDPRVQKLIIENNKFKFNDGRGCTLAGSGRGDCEHFMGLPGESIPGQHDGPDDTVDVYGKPNGWCWSCWKDKQRKDNEKENQKLNEQISVLKAKIKKVSDLAEPYLLKYNITNTLSTESLPKIIEKITKFVDVYIGSLIEDLGDLEPDSAGIDYLSESKRQIIHYMGIMEKTHCPKCDYLGELEYVSGLNWARLFKCPNCNHQQLMGDG